MKSINRNGALSSRALFQNGVNSVAELLVFAKNPLIIVGHTGRKHTSVPELVTLTDTVPGLRVLDCLGSDVCFPFSHRASLSVGIGTNEAIPKADVILVVHAAVPWVPVLCRPSPDAHIVHIDIDPLKENLSLFYILAKQTFRADATLAFRQLHTYIKASKALANIVSSKKYTRKASVLERSHAERVAALAAISVAPLNMKAPTNSHYLGHLLRESLPKDTIWCLETVANAMPITNQLQVDTPGHLVNCGAGGLGWSGGATLGVKMATDYLAGGKGEGKFVCEIVGDGTYMFGSPGRIGGLEILGA